eukprot:gene14478-19434_t
MSTSNLIRIDVIATLATFMVIGPTLVLLNQHILKAMNFPFPMFLAALGVAASSLFAHVCVFFGFVTLQRKEATEGWLWFRRVLPIGFAHACTLAFGYMANIENPTTPTIISVLVISLGTAATCSFNPDFSLLGVFIMFLSELSEAVRLILTQYFLQQLKFGIVEGQYVLSPASAAWLFMFSMYFEFPKMVEKNAFSIILNNPLTFLATSFMGIGVNFLSYLVIQYTSSLTMKVLGTVRNIFVIIIGVLAYKEVISFNETCGYLIALIGFIGYNFAKAKMFDNIDMIAYLPVPLRKTFSSYGIKAFHSDVFERTSADEADLKRLIETNNNHNHINNNNNSSIFNIKSTSSESASSVYPYKRSGSMDNL